MILLMSVCCPFIVQFVMLPRNKIKFLIKLQYAHNMICKLFMKNISDELTNLFAADFDDYVL